FSPLSPPPSPSTSSSHKPATTNPSRKPPSPTVNHVLLLVGGRRHRQRMGETREVERVGSVGIDEKCRVVRCVRS
ncbi:hypothetical protein VIGAN_02005400, partial [Vigna angularis var. angularis]